VTTACVSTPTIAFFLAEPQTQLKKFCEMAWLLVPLPCLICRRFFHEDFPFFALTWLRKSGSSNRPSANIIRLDQSNPQSITKAIRHYIFPFLWCKFGIL
jgi:hypothetical protein